MRNPSTSSITAVVSALFFLLAGLAEAVSVSEKEPAGAEAGAKQFDPHDLSGLWLRTDGTSGMGPSTSMPPLTSEGAAKMSGRVGTGDVVFVEWPRENASGPDAQTVAADGGSDNRSRGSEQSNCRFSASLNPGFHDPYPSRVFDRDFLSG